MPWRGLLIYWGLGVTVHLVYFQRYEYWRHLYTILTGFAAATVLCPLILSRYAGTPICASVLSILAVHGSFLIGGISSTFAYRVLFNPLNRFAGPYCARLTDFWLGWHVGSDLNQYRKLEILHRRYGDFVRIGATTLSIADPRAIEEALGYDSPALKGPWYDIDYPNPSMHGTRDRDAHAKLRQKWAPAFSDKALRAYNSRIKLFTKPFIGQIADSEAEPVDVTKLFSVYSFAVMSGLSFGKDEQMLQDKSLPALIRTMSDGMKLLGLSPPIWFIRLLKLVPGDPSGMKKFHAFTDSHLEDAVKSNFDVASLEPGSIISTWLYKMYQHLPNPASNAKFRSDIRLLIVGGSETVAITLTFIFFLLAKHPEHVKKLRIELGNKIKSEMWNDADIKSCEHLNGVINEALRLHPAGPSGVYRLTPPSGMCIGECYIPGNVSILMPIYVIHRHESAYTRPDEFIPERWYSQPELIRNTKALGTFSGGRFGCIGKNLAYMELRHVTASILLHFDVLFAPGEDGSRLLHESLDHFTMGLAPLHLRFTPAGDGLN
ncbi:Cytochrome P450 monooxygenase [Pseudocercospora fuligena]|uniref:Cytochrome P450 monooxygenase n=1 Tax=Pseudocercospora fuligena TaxID=685502 RepID=A0A8H6RCK2_9PEZI|nr:Cytochrome P450 monooxygenase [Pseudocercospora fuligena]